MEKIGRIKKLVSLLNMYSDSYYNNNVSLVSDYEYDILFDELASLEKETGMILSNSPTQTVGASAAVDELKKIEHKHPMLSLNKTKSVDELKSFLGARPGVLMAKMDGLTIAVTYEHGKLVRLETRGNGEVGEDITHNARAILDLPLSIPMDYAEVCGEAIICQDDFREINAPLTTENRFKTPRNMASGSVRQTDSRVCAARKVRFIAWKLVNPEPKHFIHELTTLEGLGFVVVPHQLITKMEELSMLDGDVDPIREECSIKGYPIDGEVLRFDDTAYANSLGRTGRYFRSAMAFKFYDEEERTRLEEIEWSMGRTGVLTPVAIFKTIELDGTAVSRASLHNISIFKSLELGYGDEIAVYKANMIIPQIRKNLTKSGTCQIPDTCPLCGATLQIVKDNDSEVIKCPNYDCQGKALKQLSNFVGREAMNIDGLSEATLNKLMDAELIGSPIDIYSLKDHANDLQALGGCGEKSIEKLLTAIEESKHCTMVQFLVACGIPGVGKSQAKLISDSFDHDWESFVTTSSDCLQSIDGIGEKTAQNICIWIETTYVNREFNNIVDFLSFKKPVVLSKMPLKDKMFCITGKTIISKSRKELAGIIENNGGKVSDSVSATTDYLISNDHTSNSGKVKKAHENGVSIISEHQLFELIEI